MKLDSTVDCFERLIKPAHLAQGDATDSVVLVTRMVFANSPQAKRRVKRYNSSAQLRLPTDLARLGSYDQLNRSFKEFYAPYLNSKFSYAPIDPTSDFIPLSEAHSLSGVFRTRETLALRARGRLMRSHNWWCQIKALRRAAQQDYFSHVSNENRVFLTWLFQKSRLK